MQYSSPRSGSKPPVERPSSSNRSDRSATKRSVQQSPVNRLVHSEQSPVTPGPGNTGTGQTGTGTRYPVTPGISGTPGQTRRNRVHRSHRAHRSQVKLVPVIPVPVPGNVGYTGSDQAQPVTPGALVTPGDPSLGTLLQIDPLGLGQNARWTDLPLATVLPGQLQKVSSAVIGQMSSAL